jgi:1-acyl-sn-glycerol-3-phosphate acyltransferase
MSSSLHFVEADYSYYLGNDYRTTTKAPLRASTIVSNHCSWLDAVVLIKNVRPAFAPSAEFENVPLLGTLCKTIDSIFIPRGGSEEKKALALGAIRDRQEVIEQTGKFSPFLIFAEGATTNGTSILKFKKGAFFAEKTVRPMFMKYKQGTVSPAFDIMEFLPLAILHLSWAGFSVKVNVLPDFTPNEYLFETHKDKGQERWEVYAWAIRDIMCKSGKL